MTYLSPEVKAFYMSREAMMQLRITSPNFPRVDPLEDAISLNPNQSAELVSIALQSNTVEEMFIAGSEIEQFYAVTWQHVRNESKIT